MKNLLRVSLAVFALNILASSAMAQAAPVPKPLLSVERLSVGAGLNYAFYSAPLESSARIPEFEKEWEVGVFAADNLIPHLSLVGSSAYGLDNKLFRSSVGLRVRLFQGGN
jgi:hypothetical protein